MPRHQRGLLPYYQQRARDRELTPEDLEEIEALREWNTRPMKMLLRKAERLVNEQRAIASQLESVPRGNGRIIGRA